MEKQMLKAVTYGDGRESYPMDGRQALPMLDYDNSNMEYNPEG